jgi:hypothetical protein
VFAADLNGDSDTDLAVANRHSDNVSILVGNGDGTFQRAGNFGVGSSPVSVRAADLDGDNDKDLAVANLFSNNVSILSNLDNPTVSVERTTPPPRKLTIRSYPNPCRATATIKYDLPRSAHVTIDIYNILGRKVVTLLDENERAGSHQTTWNAENIARGVYFYKVQAGRYAQTKKIVLSE